ncbi:MAG: AraC family transcriptional regulator [Clostridia bacterium]|nr:AraC family transcriptional regulator [Clostridia bacterium]
MDNNRILLTYPSLQYSNSASPIPNTSTFESHCHGTYEIIYILQGGGKHIVEGIEYPLHPHALLLMRPYEYHYVCPDRNRAYERIVLYFDEDALPTAVKSHPLLHDYSGNYFPLNTLNNPIRAAFDALDGIGALSQNGTVNTPEAEALLRATITQIVLLLTKETPETPLSDDLGVVHRVIEHLNGHLTEELSLEALAREFFISKYHLCRIFHRQTGASIFTYFNTKRIALAQQMIADGENATAVAMRLGFRDYSTFYRAYRKQTGQAPVRKLHRESENE